VASEPAKLLIREQGMKKYYNIVFYEFDLDQNKKKCDGIAGYLWL